MLKSLQHKRFTMRNDWLSSSGCYWYAQAHRCIELIGNVSDSNYKRPWYVHE